MVSSVTPVHDNVLASVEHQDQQRSSMACPRFVCCILLLGSLSRHWASLTLEVRPVVLSLIHI